MPSLPRFLRNPSQLGAFGEAAGGHPEPLLGEVVNMQRVIGILNGLVRTDDGQDLIEYAMLVGLIAIATVVAVGSVGNTVHTTL